MEHRWWGDFFSKRTIDHVPVLHYSDRMMKGVVNVCRKATLKYTNFCNTSVMAQAVALAHPIRYCSVSPTWAHVGVLNGCLFKLSWSWCIMRCTTHLDTHGWTYLKIIHIWSGLKLKQNQTDIKANSNVHVHLMMMWRFLLQIPGYFIVLLVPSIRGTKQENTPWNHAHLDFMESDRKHWQEDEQNHRRIVLLCDTPAHQQFRV